MPRNRQPDLLLDHQLVRAALWCPIALALPAALVAGVAGGATAVAATLYGLATIGLTAYVAARLSASGGTTTRGIGVLRVSAAVPLRLAAVAVLLYVGTRPLGFPSRVLALAVCGGEIALLTTWCLLVLRGRTFVGPLTGKA